MEALVGSNDLLLRVRPDGVATNDRGPPIGIRPSSAFRLLQLLRPAQPVFLCFHDHLLAKGSGAMVVVATIESP